MFMNLNNSNNSSGWNNSTLTLKLLVEKITGKNLISHLFSPKYKNYLQSAKNPKIILIKPSFMQIIPVEKNFNERITNSEISLVKQKQQKE